MADTATPRQELRARWGAWSDGTAALPMPAGWTAMPLPMRDLPSLTTDQVDAALEHPVGAARLETLVSGRSRVVIAIDDITRPTRTAPLVSRLIARLESAGVSLDRITVLLATGAHRAATSADIQRKVGTIAARVRVMSHDAVADVVETPVSLAGQPVRVNRHFLEADIRVGVGGVMPHPFAGFSGGGKIVLPGLSDLDAVVRSHKYALMGLAGGAELEGNRFRRDMERAVRELGLHWTVNVVLNSDCDTAALVAGDFVAAHRVAVARAREIGATPAPATPLDALVLNAYPKDTELLQVEAALVAVKSGMIAWLRDGAPVVLLGACPDGLGEHRLFGPGGRLFRKPVRKSYLRNHLLHVVSPATAGPDARDVFWEGYPLYERWPSCVAALARTLPGSAVVGFAPNGPLHVPVASACEPEGRAIISEESSR